MNIDLEINDSINLKPDRTFLEYRILADKKDDEQIDIPESKIISLFQDYHIAFLEKNMANMIKSIQEIAKIAKKQPIYYFPELDNMSLSQLINQSLYLPNLLYHSSLLDFFKYSFQLDQLQFINSFMKNDLFLCIVNSIDVFPGNESILFQSFAVINEILKQIKELFTNSEVNSNKKNILIETLLDSEEFSVIREIVHQLLAPEFLELFLELFRRNILSNEIKIEIASIIRYSTQIKLSGIQLNNILLILHQIFEDESVKFLWPISFEILNFLIQKKVFNSVKETAEYIMIEKEFYVNCVQILSKSDSIDTIKSIIDVLKAYFKHASFLIPDIGNIFDKIIQLSIQNETLMHSTLCLINKFIHHPEHLKNFIQNFMNFEKFQFFKIYYQETSYDMKKKILKILAKLIPELTDEQVIQVIIPLNFMEDFVQILYANDLHNIFNKFIGIIVKLLRSKIVYNPPDIFWIQFEESGGVNVLQDIMYGEQRDFALRASLFFDKIYSLRPVYN